MLVKGLFLFLFCATSQAKTLENQAENFVKPIIHRCCSQDEYIDVSENKNPAEYKCENKFKFPKNLTYPTIYYKNLTRQSDKKIGDNFKIVNENPCESLKSDSYLNILDFKNSLLLENSTIIYTNSIYYYYQDYCVGNVVKDGEYLSAILACPLRHGGKLYMTILKYTKFLLIPCLFLILNVYLIFKFLPKLTSIRKCMLLHHVSAFFMAYLTLNFINIGHWKIIHIIAAFMSYYFFNASWCWFVALCFDIRWTLGGIKWELDRANRLKEFKLYAIYSWGCSAILTLGCLLIENEVFPAFNSTKPNLGLDNCYLMDKKSMGTYFFVPICFTIIATIIFFISIIKRKRYVRTIAQYTLDKMDSNRHQDNTQWIKLAFFLFILNLFNWLNDFLWLYFFNC